MFDQIVDTILQLKYLGKALTNLWNLMGTPYEDWRTFSHVTNLLSVSPMDVLEPGSLNLNIIEQVRIPNCFHQRAVT